MSVSGMLADVLIDGRGWNASSIDGSESWTYDLSEACLTALDAFVQEMRRDPRPTTGVRLRDGHLDACEACLQPVLDALNSGRGFAIAERAPLERYSVEEAQAIYWMVGQFLGLPFEQNIEGTLLYDVRDTGQDVSRGARFSVTNAESSFHTDNAFGLSIPDFVGLLCLQTAKSGGQSQLVSAVALHNALVENHPEVVETLYRPFCFDRRGQFREGEDPVSRFPICAWDGGELTFRYLHYYIQVGHREAGVPLAPDQEEALEVLEALLRRPEFRVEFGLEPGQMLFTNNRWILHNRTAFEDHAEEDHRRHYVRLWLSRKEGER